MKELEEITAEEMTEEEREAAAAAYADRVNREAEETLAAWMAEDLPLSGQNEEADQ